MFFCRDTARRVINELDRMTEEHKGLRVKIMNYELCIMNSEWLNEA